MKYSNIWKIKIDKTPRFTKDRDEATEMLAIAEEMKYETMFLKGNKTNEFNETQQKSVKKEEVKEIEVPDKTDEEIL